jgi:coenzyme Q-binding protein COQ10
VISSVESYSQFLPFLNESTVTARDPETGYPTQAYLTVGYGPLSETFTSRVDCDPSNWIVEARSGAKYGKPDGSSSGGGSASSGLSGFFPGASEGIFEYLSTKWELVPVAPLEAQGGPQTKVNLEVRFEFRNQLHATVMGAVEGQMASTMIEAFEKRIRESHTRGQ